MMPLVDLQHYAKDLYTVDEVLTADTESKTCHWLHVSLTMQTIAYVERVACFNHSQYGAYCTN